MRHSGRFRPAYCCETFIYGDLTKRWHAAWLTGAPRAPCALILTDLFSLGSRAVAEAFCDRGMWRPALAVPQKTEA